MIKVLDDFISEEESIFFINYIDANRNNKSKFPLTKGEANGKIRGEANIPELVDLKKHDDALGMIKKISDRALSKFHSIFEEKDLCISSFWMVILGPNTRIPMHKDSIKFAEHLYLTCTVYLNDDYQGGKINFPDIEFSYQPKKYSAIFFPSSYIHGVEEITDGLRYTLPIWASKDKSRDMFRENPVPTDPFQNPGVDANDPMYSYLIERYNNYNIVMQ